VSNSNYFADNKCPSSALALSNYISKEEEMLSRRVRNPPNRK